jgi:hypothetical protein
MHLPEVHFTEIHEKPKLFKTVLIYIPDKKIMLYPKNRYTSKLSYLYVKVVYKMATAICLGKKG